MDSGAIIGGVIGGVITFVGYILVSKWQRQKAQEDEKLGRHFEDIKALLETHILPMARSLKIKNDRLCYDDRTLVLKSYDFETEEVYKCFEIHFPEMEREWKRLNEEALKFSEPLKKQAIKRSMIEIIGNVRQDDATLTKSKKYYENTDSQLLSSIEELKDMFKDFAIKVDNKIESISKYGIGREFRRVKKCPICKRI